MGILKQTFCYWNYCFAEGRSPLPNRPFLERAVLMLNLIANARLLLMRFVLQERNQEAEILIAAIEGL